MRETETSAPSLGAVPAGATEAMKQAGTALALRIGLSSEYGWHEYMADLWATMLAAAPPTAMTEAVASARAEGYMAGAMDMRDTAANAINASAHRLFGEEADALCVAALGTATLMVRGLPLIPGGSSDV